MVTEIELFGAVDAAFEATGRGLAPWPNPHPDRPPHDDEYSRLANPAKWRIVGARADAWLVAAADLALATVQRRTEVQWAPRPGTAISQTDRVTPHATGALPLVLGTVDDAGVTLGVGDPAICVAWFPHCGCDACDTGSEDVLDDLDNHIFGVISGAFRRLSSGGGEITVIRKGRWRASGVPASSDVNTVLAHPTGWHEVAGPSWLDHA